MTGRPTVDTDDFSDEIMLFDDEDEAGVGVPPYESEGAVEVESEELEMDSEGETVEVSESEGESDGEAQAEPEPEIVVEKDVRHVIYVDNKNCFRCTHLTSVLNGVKVGGAPLPIKPFKSCFWKNGNENCPAKGIRIEIGVNAEAFVIQLTELERAHDDEGVAAMMSRLTRLDDGTRAKIYRMRMETKIRDDIQAMIDSGMQPSRQYLMVLGRRYGVIQPDAAIPTWFGQLAVDLGL